ncbi:MAG: hypothetical protein ACRCT6_09200 [Notoacmeibacter sp.]
MRDMTTYTVFPLLHKSVPLEVCLFEPSPLLLWEFELPKLSVYEAKRPENETDFHKWMGVSFDLFGNHQNSVMLAGYWDKSKRAHVAGPYCHIAGKTIHPWSFFTHEIELETPYSFALKARGFRGDPQGELGKPFVSAYLIDGDQRILTKCDIEMPRLKNASIWRRIYPWFGGQETPRRPWQIQQSFQRPWPEDYPLD